MSHPELALLLRLNRSWYDGIPAEKLYEITRAWWVMSQTNAEHVERVFAVADGIIREVYRPYEWLRSPAEGFENRIGFHGSLAPDRDTFVGTNVAHLFKQGSANPVRYLPLSILLTDPALNPVKHADSTPSSMTTSLSETVEPELLERVVPLLEAFESDLLWTQSRAGQELFHSNTIAWLLKNHPGPTKPILNLFGAVDYDGVSHVNVWRERRNLDIVIEPVGPYTNIVVENKLYSVPYPAQLVKYNRYTLPWSDDHGDEGARDTRYVLLSLMSPSFPLPDPWKHVDYRGLADALDLIEAESLGKTNEQFSRYRALIRRLVALAEAVDPAQALDEQFSAAEAVAQLPGGGLASVIHEAV